MRERLVAAFVGLTVLVVACYGVPRAYFLGDLVRSDEQARVDRTAEVLRLLVDERVADGRPVTSDYLDSIATSGEWISVSPGSGDPVSSAGDPGDPGEEVLATRALAAGGEVTVARTADAIGDEVARALLPLVLLGLLLAVVAGLVAWFLARRLSRPFQELAVVARDIGEGRLHPEVARYDVPEARAIGAALVEAGNRLDLLLARERHVAVHASHELRTPVTALRLELEDLALWPETPDTVAAELQRCVAELDRLSVAITDLLELAESRRSATEIDLDLDALLADTATRHRDGLQVVHEPTAPALTRADPLPVLQALDALVDEARRAGADRVALSAVSRTGLVELRVAGAPAVVPEDEGWSRARDLAAAAGGQVARDGTTLVLRLPRRAPHGPVFSSQ